MMALLQGYRSVRREYKLKFSAATSAQPEVFHLRAIAVTLNDPDDSPVAQVEEFLSAFGVVAEVDHETTVDNRTLLTRWL